MCVCVVASLSLSLSLSACVCLRRWKVKMEGKLYILDLYIFMCVCVCVYVLPDTHAGRAHASVKTHDIQKRKDGAGVCIWTQLLPAHACKYKHIPTYRHIKTETLARKHACIAITSQHRRSQTLSFLKVIETDRDSDLLKGLFIKGVHGLAL